MEKILEIQGLNVSIAGSDILNLKDETIIINKGDIVGIIGENGAGKTTLINCIIDKIHYSGNIERGFCANELGVQFQINSYNKLMKVFEIIQIVTGITRFDEEFEKKLSQFELKGLLKKKIGKLSVGELQRLTLFLVLYLKPNVLIFDELTTGLDYQKRTELLELVKEYSKGKTVFTITHYFEELLDWANKFLILHKGNLVFYGTLNELQEKYKHQSIIKIPINVKESFINQCGGNITMVDLNEKYTGVVVYTEEEQRRLIKKISGQNIGFQIEPNGIYSLYTLAIMSMKGDEKIC